MLANRPNVLSKNVITFQSREPLLVVCMPKLKHPVSPANPYISGCPRPLYGSVKENNRMIALMYEEMYGEAVIILQCVRRDFMDAMDAMDADGDRGS